jgi:uroporphyrinogen-III decarboxylase
MLTYQFVEEEYMLAEEYDEFLKDPADFVIRKMMPRMADTLKPLEMLPPIHWMSSGYTMIMLFSTFAGVPPIIEMLKKIVQVGEEMNKYNAVQAKLAQDLAVMGYPMITASFTEAPFDWISDMFRGLRGVMLDMYRRPDKLKAAMETITPFMINCALGLAQQTGNTRVFIPLHRGAGGFMSNQQFEEFYWPYLTRLMEAMIEKGHRPMPFFEGYYDQRLEYLANFAKKHPGKCVFWFHRTNMKKAKEMMGDYVTIRGNVPESLMIGGTPQQMEDYVKQLLEDCMEGGGFLLDGGCSGIVNEARHENIVAMARAARKYGVYKK